MKAAFVRIARSKTSDPGALAALADVEAAAQAFEDAEASFPDRINAGKALRGEPPTRLSRGKRAELDELANDQANIDRDLIEQLSGLESARSVIEALHFGLAQDIPRARALLKHYPPADRPLGEDLVLHKERLADAMSAYLREYRDDA